MFKGISTATAAVIGVIVAVLVIAIVVVYVNSGFSSFTADTRGKTSVREKTKANGDYRIANYDKFYDECEAVVANESRQKVQAKDVQRATSADDKQRAEVNLEALQSTHADLATTYNGDSSKAGTQAQFKASDLPYSIDPNVTEGTTCSR